MIEPSVSVPIEKPTRPAAVAAPGPADDPLELRSMFHGIVRRAAEPHAALRERAHRQLRDQHRARIAQPLDDGRVEIDALDPCRASRPRWS